MKATNLILFIFCFVAVFFVMTFVRVLAFYFAWMVTILLTAVGLYFLIKMIKK